MNDPLKLILRLFRQILSQKISRSPRNDFIRNQIIASLASQFLTDTERADMLGLPEGCRVRESAKIICPQLLRLGSHCNFAENSIIDASGGLSIGSHTTIGVGVLVWSHSSHMANLLHANHVGSPLIIRKQTTIGSGCFISGPSVVQAGSTIGNSCLIQPFSNVNGTIPDRSIVTSNSTLPGILTDDRLLLMKKLSFIE